MSEILAKREVEEFLGMITGNDNVRDSDLIFEIYAYN
jgi:hypothetical protein